MHILTLKQQIVTIFKYIINTFFKAFITIHFALADIPANISKIAPTAGKQYKQDSNKNKKRNQNNNRFYRQLHVLSFPKAKMLNRLRTHTPQSAPAYHTKTNF